MRRWLILPAALFFLSVVFAEAPTTASINGSSDVFSSNFTSAEPSSTEAATTNYTAHPSTTRDDSVATSTTTEKDVIWIEAKEEEEDEEEESKEAEKMPDVVVDAQRDAGRTRVVWILVGVVIAAWVLILGELVVLIWLKWRQKKKAMTSQDSDRSKKVPEDDAVLKNASKLQDRSPGEETTKNSSKISTSDSKSSANPTPPELEAKKDPKETDVETKVEMSITKPVDPNVKTIPDTLTKRKSIPEYWKEDSKKAVEAVRSATFEVDDALFGYTDGTSGGLKFFKADSEEEKAFVGTREMISQMAEAKAALGRRIPHVEMTQSSRKKNIAATLRKTRTE